MNISLARHLLMLLQFMFNHTGERDVDYCWEFNDELKKVDSDWNRGT